MKIKMLLVLSLASLTGCNVLFPKSNPPKHQDPSTVCRATPTWYILPHSGLSDNVRILTGEVNGDDGAMETVTLCKQDILCGNYPSKEKLQQQWRTQFCGDHVAAQCVIVGSTGALDDGTFINFDGRYVEIDNAQSHGYLVGDIQIDESCHGGGR